ncbi:MAG: hypothetical protein AB7E80_10225 [Hyphomicrobiaceae bacterium]
MSLCGIALLHVPVRAEGVDANLVCSFDAGFLWAYEGGKFASRNAEPLQLEIADIDLEAQTARLKSATGAGAGALRVVRALNANHFLEVLNEGFLTLTTVYDLDPAIKAYPAVHSRHLGLLGQPIVAQYSGFCRKAG